MNNKVKLNLEDYESYKEQILHSMKIRLMAGIQDKIVLKWINKQIKTLKANKQINKTN